MKFFTREFNDHIHPIGPQQRAGLVKNHKTSRFHHRIPLFHINSVRRGVAKLFLRKTMRMWYLMVRMRVVVFSDAGTSCPTAMPRLYKNRFYLFQVCWNISIIFPIRICCIFKFKSSTKILNPFDLDGHKCIRKLFFNLGHHKTCSRMQITEQQQQEKAPQYL